jgi:hypothetical protein
MAADETARISAVTRPMHGLKRLWLILRDFDTEPVEVVLGLLASIVGVLILLDPTVFSSAAYATLRAISGARYWGGFMLLVGLFKLWGATDGRRKLRVAATTLAAVFWLAVSLSLWLSGLRGLGNGAYPLFFVVSLWLGWRLGKTHDDADSGATGAN